MQRRKFIGFGGSLFAATLAGCLSSNDEDSGNGNGSDTDEEDSIDTDALTGSATPDPTVVDLRHPEPRGVSVDSEALSNGYREFSSTVENTGMAGDIELTLVLLESQDISIWSPLADEKGSFQRFFSDGERRTETFTAEWENKYEAYGFRMLPAEAEADVRNDGETGDVDVQLLQSGGLGDGTVIEEKTVEIATDTTHTVSFSVDASFALETDIDDIQLEARASVGSASN